MSTAEAIFAVIGLIFALFYGFTVTVWGLLVLQRRLAHRRHARRMVADLERQLAGRQ